MNKTNRRAFVPGGLARAGARQRWRAVRAAPDAGRGVSPRHVAGGLLGQREVRRRAGLLGRQAAVDPRRRAGRDAGVVHRRAAGGPDGRRALGWARPIRTRGLDRAQPDAERCCVAPDALHGVRLAGRAGRLHNPAGGPAQAAADHRGPVDRAGSPASRDHPRRPAGPARQDRADGRRGPDAAPGRVALPGRTQHRPGQGQAVRGRRGARRSPMSRAAASMAAGWARCGSRPRRQALQARQRLQRRRAREAAADRQLGELPLQRHQPERPTALCALHARAPRPGGLKPGRTVAGPRPDPQFCKS